MMKPLELVQLCIAILAIVMAFLFSATTIGAVSIHKSIMLAVLYTTISIVTVDEFVLTWRWKNKYAIPKPDRRVRTKLLNYNAYASVLFLIGVILLVANLASGAIHFGFGSDDSGRIHVRGTLLDGFTILTVILYCSLRTYLTWRIVPELANKSLFRTRQAMTAVIIGLAVCFLVGVILNVHAPSDLKIPEFITYLPGFFIPVGTCMFRLATNQELNDRRISPGDPPEIYTHPPPAINPWPQSAPTDDVPTMLAGGTTASWVQPPQQ